MKIRHGSEYFHVDELTGNVTRPEIEMNEPSGEWRIVGAVLFNNFGHIVARAYFKDITAGNITEWQYKNGKQKWHIVDYDHGSYRTWMSPNHNVEL